MAGVLRLLLLSIFEFLSVGRVDGGSEVDLRLFRADLVLGLAMVLIFGSSEWRLPRVVAVYIVHGHHLQNVVVRDVYETN